MKKKRVIAILMAMFFLGITLTVFSTNYSSNSGQATGSGGGDIKTISSADTNGVFVPE